MKKVWISTSLAVASLGCAVVFATQVQADSAMYRLYNPNSGEHFYTANTYERDHLIRVGWKGEGIGWYAPDSGENVHRLYNPNAGDHHYTLSTGERDYLVKVGWRYEGVGWKSAPKTGVPLYRLYNPNARTGTHHYTTNKGESDYLDRIGWNYEGIAWYGTKAGGPETPSPAPAPNPAPASPSTPSTVPPRKVDEHITTTGGGEGNNPGSYRLLYSNKAFDAIPSHYTTPTIEFSADMVMTGVKSANADYGMQFIIAGNGNASGQIGLDIGYQAGTSAEFAQGRIAVKTVNFPAGSGNYGQQFYSTNTNINIGDSAKLVIQYFKGNQGDFIVAKVNGQNVGIYKTSLTTPNAYILHAQINDARGNANLKLNNIKVTSKGIDITGGGLSVVGGSNAKSTNYNLVANTNTWQIHGAFYAK